MGMGMCISHRQQQELPKIVKPCEGPTNSNRLRCLTALQRLNNVQKARIDDVLRVEVQQLLTVILALFRCHHLGRSLGAEAKATDSALRKCAGRRLSRSKSASSLDRNDAQPGRSRKFLESLHRQDEAGRSMNEAETKVVRPVSRASAVQAKPCGQASNLTSR